MKKFRKKTLTVLQQYLKLKSSVKGIISNRCKMETLEVEFEVKPTPLSRLYRIKIEYERYSTPKVYVISPNIRKLANYRKLPHVYSDRDKRLCLYLPKSGEWHSNMFISESILPWTYLWLFYFEEWLYSNEWKGGGVEHSVQEKEAF